MNNKRYQLAKNTIIVNLLLIPVLLSFFIVMINNYEKYSSLLKTCVFTVLVISILTFVIELINLIKNYQVLKTNILKKVAFVLAIGIYFFESMYLINYIYYNDTFKSWLINSSMSSINYKDLASSLYSKYTIDDFVQEGSAVKKDDVISFDMKYDINIYANQYEKQVLEREPGTIYKIFKITGTTSTTGSTYVGYITAIYDPSKVKLAKSRGAGTEEDSYGETLSTIAKNNNALVAINAGGFYDPDWNSNGGIPHGDVIIDGKLDSSFRAGGFGGGLIALTYDNKLVLKKMSAEQAIEMGVRDAVDWGPYLIVDGVNQFSDDYYSNWEVGRTAIAQREDGIILFLVVDNLQEHSVGVSYRDAAEILETYGAINASCLDGGTSTQLMEQGEYINSPWNGSRPTYRRLPNAWIVVE